MFFFWQAHNICVPLTNKVYRYVQKTNRKGWRQGRQGDRWVTHTSKQWRAECVFGKGLPLVCVCKSTVDGGGERQLQATSRSTANVHRQQLPNEIVYGKPQCEKCHLFAKMSKAKGRARFRRTTDSTRRQQTERQWESERGGEQRGENKCGSCLRSWQKANGSGLLGNGGATSGNEPTWLPHEALVLALSQTPGRGQLSVDL